MAQRNNVAAPVAQSVPAPAAAVAAGIAQPAEAAPPSRAVLTTEPPELTSRWSAPALVLGALSAAKGAIKFAPMVAEGGVALASSATDTAVYYTRRGVELGTDAIRSGVTATGNAAASHLESRGNTSAASHAKRAAHLLDKGLEYGGDLIENHVVGAVSTLAQTALTVGGGSLKSSMRTTRLMVGAADVFAKGALRASGYSTSDLEEANGGDKLVDSMMNIISELRGLNASLDAVGTAELIRTLMTYARLVETVEDESLYRRRRPVLSAYLESISQKRREEFLRAEQNSDAKAVAKESKGKEDGGVTIGKDTEKGGPAPPSKRSRIAAWFSWGGGGEHPDATGASSSAAGAGAPVVAEDPPPDPTLSYEEGLYALASGGMMRVSRCMLFSGCAYGPRFMSFLGVSTKTSTHEAFIVEQCGIAPTDLLLSDFNSSLAHPGYFLAVDHQTKQIMLVIRGSSALHDALTDLTCSFTRHVSGSFGSKGHAEGSCHEGMLKSAQWFAQHLRQPIIDARKAHPDYSLVLTGHSLGGGVASLLALLWLHDLQMNPPSRRLQGYFFGTPCVVSAELAHLGYGYLWNFVLGHDIVCRLSKGAVQDLTGVVLALTGDSRQNYNMMKMPSKQRRAAQAKIDAQKAKEREAALKSNKPQPPQVHPAVRDHKTLAVLLDRYHALLERSKKDGMDAPLTKAEEAQALAADKAVHDAAVAAGAVPPADSAAAAAGSVALVRTIRSESQAILRCLTAILLALRRGMKSEKLFPLGHIFHLLPKDPNGVQDKQEREEVQSIVAQATGEKQEAGGAESAAAAAAVAVDAAQKQIGQEAAAASAAPAHQRRRTVQVSQVSQLSDIIGAQPQPMLIDDALPPADGSKKASAAAKLHGAAIQRTPNGSAPMEDVAGGSSSWIPSFLRAGSRSAPSASAPSAAAAASASAAQPAGAPVARTRIPIAQPVGASAASSIPPPVSVAGAKRKADSSPQLTPTKDDGGHASVYPDVHMASASPPFAQSQAQFPAQTYSPGAAAPVAVAVQQPPVAASASSASAASAAAVLPSEPLLFSHPELYDVVAGHWSDLTDLILSSNMLQHHLPAAYFVALATHETTREQTLQLRQRNNQNSAAAANSGAAGSNGRS